MSNNKKNNPNERSDRNKARRAGNEQRAKADKKAKAPLTLAQKQAKDPNAILHAAGGRGTDASADANISSMSEKIDLKVPTASQVLQIICKTQTRSVSYLAMGIVLRAIKQGLLANLQPGVYAYHIFRFLIDCFLSAMNSGTSLLTQAPMWYWEIYHAIKPKQASFKTADIQYDWAVIASPTDDSQFFSLGAGPTAFTLFWGTTCAGPSVNGFPILSTVPGYTQPVGLSAVASLWSSCSSQPLIADPGVLAFCHNDTSAFAINYPELGNSWESVGGMRSTIYSERHIDTPLFSKFAEYQPVGSNIWRGWHKAGLSAGSPSMIGPLVMDIGASKPYLRNKVAPTVKTYNFDEIFETLSLTMCLALEAASLNTTFTIVPCPLTSQQVQILLRQAIIGFFNNDMFQDLRYDGADRVDLLPFVVGPNGSQSATIDMLLPTFLAENIRCMKMIGTKTSKKFKNSIATWYSVLTRPAPSEYPQLGQYLWGPSNLDLWFTDVTEIPINIIDMSTNVAQNTFYLDASRTEIQELKTIWNDWVIKYTNTLSPLCSITGQKGVRVLNCNLLTNGIQKQPELAPVVVVPPTTSKRKSLDIPTAIGLSMHSKRRKLGAVPANGSSYFGATVDNDTTAVENIKPETWPFFSKWILPVDYANDIKNDASAQGVRTFQVEPNRIPRSSVNQSGGVAGEAISRPDLFIRHLNAATVDVKAHTTTSQNELILYLVKMGEDGRGGFFTSLVSNLVNTFSPEAAQVISTIGNVIGV